MQHNAYLRPRQAPVGCSGRAQERSRASELRERSIRASARILPAFVRSRGGDRLRSVTTAGERVEIAPLTTLRPGWVRRRRCANSPILVARADESTTTARVARGKSKVSSFNGHCERHHPGADRGNHGIPAHLQHRPSPDRGALARRTVRDVQCRDPGRRDPRGDDHLLETHRRPPGQLEGPAQPLLCGEADRRLSHHRCARLRRQEAGFRAAGNDRAGRVGADRRGRLDSRRRGLRVAQGRHSAM